MIEYTPTSKPVRGNRWYSHCGGSDEWYSLLYRNAKGPDGYNLIQICRSIDIDDKNGVAWVEFSYTYNPKGNIYNQLIFRLFGLFHKPPKGWTEQRHFKEDAELKRDGDHYRIVRNETCLPDAKLLEFAENKRNF